MFLKGEEFSKKKFQRHMTYNSRHKRAHARRHTLPQHRESIGMFKVST